MRFILELIARKERRTVSSLAEWCIQEALDASITMRDPREPNPERAKGVSGLLAGNLVWDIEEADRFVKQACAYPETLNIPDQQIWKVITEVDRFHRIKQPARPEDFKLKLLRLLWPDIKETAEGRMTVGDLGRRAT